MKISEKFLIQETCLMEVSVCLISTGSSSFTLGGIN